MTECQVCFCDIEGEKFSCSNPECRIETCSECTEALINYSLESELIPSCVDQNCKANYIYSGIKSLSKESLNNYKKACMKFFMKGHGNTVQKKLEESKILEKLRQERTKFINEEYPAAIALVAKLTFTSKLRQLEKQKSQVISQQLRMSKKQCTMLTCNGFLDTNMECMTCGNSYCKECEVRIKSGQVHVCKQSDLDSINLVHGMVKCPGCQLPVFKDVGCDSITCSNCGTNFKYSTGEKGGHGSSNAKIEINTNQKVKISSDMRSLIDPDWMEIILKIENIEPKPKNKDSLLIPIRDLLKGGDQSKAETKLARGLNNYLKQRYICKYYQKKLMEVEELLREPGDDKPLIKRKLQTILGTLIDNQN